METGLFVVGFLVFYLLLWVIVVWVFELGGLVKIWDKVRRRK